MVCRSAAISLILTLVAWFFISLVWWEPTRNWLFGADQMFIMLILPSIIMVIIKQVTRRTRPNTY